MPALDLIDKGIIMDLDRNCRVSYEILSRKYNLAANSIKRRIEKLLESGVIQRFTIELSLAMMDSELMLALISTEGLEDEIFRKTFTENGVIVAGGLGHLAGKVFRMGHMGNLTSSQAYFALEALEKTLASIGYSGKLNPNAQ